MPKINFTVHSDVEPERFLAALRDFSPRRPEVWPNLDAGYFQVHASGEDWAEVTEGSAFAGGVWERVHYDWSTPDTVRLEVLASNAFAPGSFWLYRVQPAAPGARIGVTVDRRPATWKGRLLAVPLTLFGRRIFRADLERALARLDARCTS